MTRLFRLIGLREIAARPARGALAVVGIALGVALVLAIQLANQATLGALRQTVEGTFTWGIEAITLVVAFVGVFDTVFAGVLARRREIGVLRALGSLRRRVATAFALEGLLVGGLAAALGVAGGLALAFTWVHLVFPNVLGYVTDLHVSAVRLAGVAGASLLLAAVAAVLPARRAAHLAVS